MIKFSSVPVLWYSVLFLLFIEGCAKETGQPQIPVVPVNFSIDPNSTQYLELNHPGGSEYLTGGYRGILVYRISATEFVAFERACPYDFDNPDARIVVDTSMITCYCPVCKSEYILTDGTPFQGPSRYALKQYSTTYDGVLLYVYN
jgi:nitrite reductase/ring-hydroxylating ferredoxin subunit